jgi:hypothetical protein
MQSIAAATVTCTYADVCVVGSCEGGGSHTNFGPHKKPMCYVRWRTPHKKQKLAVQSLTICELTKVVLTRPVQH